MFGSIAGNKARANAFLSGAIPAAASGAFAGAVAWLMLFAFFPAAFAGEAAFVAVTGIFAAVAGMRAGRRSLARESGAIRDSEAAAARGEERAAVPQPQQTRWQGEDAQDVQERQEIKNQLDFRDLIEQQRQPRSYHWRNREEESRTQDINLDSPRHRHHR